MQGRLESLSTIDTGNVSVSGTWPQFDVAFQSALGGQDIELLGGRNLTASTLVTGGPAENEVQHLTISSLATGGTFTLTFSGQTTGPLDYNATASSVQMALEFLSAIGMGNVAVTQEPGGPYVITFQGSKAATDVSQLIVNDGNLQGGTIATATNVQGQPQLDEVQQVTVSDAYSGTFTLSFSGQATGSIAFDAVERLPLPPENRPPAIARSQKQSADPQHGNPLSGRSTRRHCRPG